MSEHLNTIKKILQENIRVKNELFSDETLIKRVGLAAEMLTKALKAGNKVMFCGNGGSAADAQHLAAELSGKFMLDRPPIHAEALHVNSSFITAASNDMGYQYAFARAVEGKGANGDVLVAISTSGNSDNIVHAVEAGRKKNIRIIGMTGKSGGVLKDRCDLLLNVPADNTARIQECHILLGHIMCQLVEENLFGV